MKFQKMEPTVDFLGQTYVADHFVHGADPPAADALDALAQFIATVYILKEIGRAHV